VGLSVPVAVTVLVLGGGAVLEVDRAPDALSLAPDPAPPHALNAAAVSSGATAPATRLTRGPWPGR
jgi:uncharacterized protein GlcG (DUF336 family)